MQAILIIIGITLVPVLAFTLGERGALFLPRLSAKFNRKPLNCRPCLTFWIHGLGMALIALITHSWIIVISGVVTAFIVFGIVWSMERKRVIE